MSHISGRSALQMEEDQSLMTEMIYDLALEIIFLLTGEKHAAVKIVSIENLLADIYPRLSVGGSLSTMPITKRPSPSQMPKSNNQKILEVTSKIMELLAGEVSGAGGGTLDNNHFLDRVMEDPPPLTSLEYPNREEQYDAGSTYIPHSSRVPETMRHQSISVFPTHGSRKRANTERDPSPLHSKDSSQDYEAIYQDQGHQVSEEKEKVEEPNMRGDQVSGELNIKEVKEEPEEPYVRGDEWVTDGETSTELPAVSAPEDYRGLHHYLESNLVNVRPQQEAHVRGGERCKEEEINSHVSADWRLAQGIREQTFDIISNGSIQNDNNITLESSDIPNLPSGYTPELFSFLQSGKRFSKRFNFNSHKRLPKGDKSYSCSICGKCFAQATHLKAHLPIHSGEKPYSCSVCGKSFSRKFSYITHMRVHTGEKPYSCLQCGRCFSQSAHLLGHQRMHTGEKPYSCPDCGKRFAQKSNFMRHRKSHT